MDDPSPTVVKFPREAGKFWERKVAFFLQYV